MDLRSNGAINLVRFCLIFLFSYIPGVPHEGAYLVSTIVLSGVYFRGPYIAVGTHAIFTFISTGLVLLPVPATRGSTVNSIYRQNETQ